MTKANGIEVDRRALELAARASADVAVALPIGTTDLTVELAGGDVLHLDDSATVSIAGLRHIRVVVVSPNRNLWERALNAIPGVEAIAFTLERDAKQIKLPAGDVYVFEKSCLPNSPKAES